MLYHALRFALLGEFPWMSDVFSAYSGAVLDLFVASAPYLLLGFAIAGVLQVVLPSRHIHRWMGRDDFRSVATASLFGIPLPLCSCSVIPTALALRRRGASKGATSSFLISTPETGVDSIGITWALLGPLMTVARPISALVSALMTGSLVNLLVRRGWDGEAGSPAHAPSCGHADADEASDQGSEPAEAQGVAGREHEHGADHSGEGGWLQRATRFALKDLLDDLAPWLVLGFLLSGFIALVVPDDFFGAALGTGWTSLLMLVAGVPVYICAAATTPIAAALMVKGLDPGAALVLLLVGPATNAATLPVLVEALGLRLVAVYLLGVSGVALVAGFVVNLLTGADGIVVADVVGGTAAEASALHVVSAVVLAVLLLGSCVRQRALAGLVEGWNGSLGRVGLRLHLGVVRAACLLVAVLGLASTSMTLVRPGEQAWAIRFGRVAQTFDTPGLHVHWPAPIDRITRVRPQEVRAVEVGFTRDVGSGEEDDAALVAERMQRQRELEDAAEVLTGDQNLLRLEFAVHYAMTDAARVQFHLEDAETLMRACAESAMREVVSGRTADAVLVDERALLGAEVAAALTRTLEVLDCGLGVEHVTIRDVHASGPAHYDFRAVASALEHRERLTHEAEETRVSVASSALMAAEEAVARAREESVRKVAEARGVARAFDAEVAAWNAYPAVTRARLRLAAVEAALREVPLLVLLGAGVDLESWRMDATPPVIMPGESNGSLPPGFFQDEPSFPSRR